METIHSGPEIDGLVADASDRPALLDEPLDESPALVWLKDLEGRYLRVNYHYSEFLGTSEDRLRGHTDAELAARETVDGPRLHGTDHATQEPLQLEYIVPAFDGRPALLALRFPVRDRHGEAVAVCGVAAPVDAAHIARAEADRLMALQQRSSIGPPITLPEPPMAAEDFVPEEPAGPKPAERSVSASLARASAWRAVLNDVIAVLGSDGGWDTVTVWVPGPAESLSCAATWTAHPGLGRLEIPEISSGSLLGHALHAPHPTWLNELDVVDDDRLIHAAAHGMCCAVLVPVRDGATAIALLELLTHADLKPDPALAMSLEGAALRLGRLGRAVGV